MADNIDITQGTGTTIATDDVGGVQYQRVKLVDGTADSSTAIAAGGGVEAGALRVTLASDSTGVVSIDDNGGAITVDGTVSVTSLQTDALTDTQLRATAVPVSVATIPSHAVTNAGTFAVQAVCTNAGTFAVQADLGANNDVTVTGTVDLGATDNAVLDSIAAKDFATQTTLAAINTKLASGTVIGDVNLGATDNAVLDAIAASDASIDGKITACNTGAVVISSGSCTVDLGANNDVTVTSGTITAELSATDNAVLDVIAANTAKEAITGYGQARLDDADVTTAQAFDVGAAAVADKKFYITSIILSVAAAGTYWIEDDDAAQITCKFTLADNGGVSWTACGETPYKSTTANKGLKVKGSTAGVVGCMITYYVLA